MFVKKTSKKRRLMLHPLMDVFFILMLFFLITAASRQQNGQGLDIPVRYAVPVPDFGRTNLFLQIADKGNINEPDSVYWIDFYYAGGTGDIPDTNKFSVDEITSKFRTFAWDLRNDGRSEINVVIRCPIDLPYATAEKIKNVLFGVSCNIAGAKVDYALLAGSIEDIEVVDVNKKGKKTRLKFGD